MNILGIETSCDETAASVYSDEGLISNVISSQEIHRQFGGVVPELASRAHEKHISGIVAKALENNTGINLEKIDAVAVTQGPGLMGALLVGVCFAKGIALQTGKPILGINHIDAHVYANFIEHKPEFPFLSLVVSGGHTQLTYVDKPFSHKLLGKTRDDAAGEAFDKTGKILGLPYPAGPEMDKMAKNGNPKAFKFPRAMMKEGLDFSYSGLKTSVLYHIRDIEESKREEYISKNLPDLCASISDAITDVLIAKLKRAAKETGAKDILIAGGVSANSMLRKKAQQWASRENRNVFIPSPVYCTDNAAMIAVTGYMKAKAGLFDDLSMRPFTRY